VTDGYGSAGLSLGSGGDAYAVGRAVASGKRYKEAAQRRACDEKRWQGKNRPHGALQSDDGAQAKRDAVSGARPPGQVRTLLLAGRNEAEHFAAPCGRDVASCLGFWDAGNKEAPQAQLTGVQKAPRHEVAGSWAPAEQRALWRFNAAPGSMMGRMLT